MKKYLMTGIAALAMCAGFTSCSHDEITPLTQEEIDANKAEMITKNYEQGFLNYLGTTSIASSQDWGFGSATRYGNTEQKLAGQQHGSWNVPAALTGPQMERVKQYFQKNRQPDGVSINFTDFFVQQVYEGTTDPYNVNSTEKYQAANGTIYDAGQQMDELKAGNGEHINNFNSATATERDILNNDVSDANNWNVGVTTHKDRIMFMQQSSTAYFGYNQSGSSYIHNNRFVIIPAAEIDDWASRNGNPGAPVVDSWDRYFVGIDFDMLPIEQCYSSKKFTFNNVEYNYLISDRNLYYADRNEPTYHGVKEFTDKKDVTDNVKQELLALDYLPVDGSDDKVWVKVGSCRDYYFSDWIICVTEGLKKADLRIMAEDLNPDSSDPSDYDFNDVVLDVYYGAANQAKVVVKAAGGTLPLYVQGQEVHTLYSAANNNINCTGKMINTRGTLSDDANVRKLSLDGLKAPSITLPFQVYSPYDAKNIEIKVTRDGVDVVLKANQGEPASKFAVTASTDWCDERQEISNKYPNFKSWAANNNPLVWWAEY